MHQRAARNQLRSRRFFKLPKSVTTYKPQTRKYRRNASVGVHNNAAQASTSPALCCKASRNCCSVNCSARRICGWFSSNLYMDGRDTPNCMAAPWIYQSLSCIACKTCAASSCLSFLRATSGVLRPDCGWAGIKAWTAGTDEADEASASDGTVLTVRGICTNAAKSGICPICKEGSANQGQA